MPRAILAGASIKAPTTTPMLLAAADPARKKLILVNHSTTAVFIGPSNVASTTGVLLAGVVGQTLTLDTPAAVYGITASGTGSVGVFTDTTAAVS